MKIPGRSRQVWVYGPRPGGGDCTGVYRVVIWCVYVLFYAVN
jgi:hypothetical protein